MVSLSRILCVTLVILVSLGLSGSSSGDEPEDGVALMESVEKIALYSAIQGFVGKWWNGSDLYPDPCGWTPIQGVSCDIFDGFWYVTELNIGPVHDNSLSCGQNVEFRPQLFQLTHLKSLSFFNCFTSLHHPTAIPTAYATWQKLGNSLDSLEFRSNPGLIGQIPPDLSSLRKLQSLVLLENGLSGQIPSDLGSLQSLKRLVLSGNKLTGQIPSTFGNLSELLILDLSRNSLSGSLPFTFGGLISVLKLDLSGNKIGGRIPKELSKLKSLTLLDLSGNNLTGGLDEVLWWKMESLEEMVLSNNQIGGELNGLEWEKMIKLRFLDLGSNNLTGKMSLRLAKMPNLSALYLNKNNLSGKIDFPDWFYVKMGSRLRLKENPNLCYLSSSGSASSARALGVEPCQSEETANDHTLGLKLGDVGNQEFLLMASSWRVGFGRGINGFWLGLLVEPLIVGLLIA